MERHVLNLFEAAFAEEQIPTARSAVLKTNPNRFDTDPAPFYDSLAELFGIPDDETSDDFGGFGGRLEQTIDFIASRWDGTLRRPRAPADARTGATAKTRKPKGKQATSSGRRDSAFSERMKSALKDDALEAAVTRARIEDAKTYAKLALACYGAARRRLLEGHCTEQTLFFTRASLGMNEKLVGRSHVTTASSMELAAVTAAFTTTCYGRAGQLLRDALAVREEQQGAKHADTARVRKLIKALERVEPFPVLGGRRVFTIATLMGTKDQAIAPYRQKHLLGVTSKLGDGDRLGKSFPNNAALILEPSQTNFLGSFIANMGDLLIVTSQVREIIVGHCRDKLETFRLKILNHKQKLLSDDYWLINPDLFDCVARVDCESVLRKKYVLKATHTKTPGLFRIPEDPEMYLATEALVADLMKARVTNLELKEVATTGTEPIADDKRTKSLLELARLLPG